MDQEQTQEQTPEPSLLISLIPIVVLMGLLITNIVVYGDAGLDGSNQLALLIASSIKGGLAGTESRALRSTANSVARMQMRCKN